MTAREPRPDVLTAGGSGDRQTVPSSVVEAARAGDADAFMAIYDAYVKLRGSTHTELSPEGMKSLLDALVPNTQP